MAATRARVRTADRTRSKEASRLGSEQAWAEAATWRTFAEAQVNRDGSGFIRVTRDGEVLHTFEFDSEETIR